MSAFIVLLSCAMLCRSVIGDDLASANDKNARERAFAEVYRAAATSLHDGQHALLRGHARDVDLNGLGSLKKTPKTSVPYLERRDLQEQVAELQPVRFGDIEVAAISKFRRVWVDEFSGAKLYVSIYEADLTAVELGQGWRVLGQLIRPNYKDISGVGVTIVARNVNSSNPVLLPPVDYERIWIDSGSGASRRPVNRAFEHPMDGSVWRPLPAQGYVCLGDMFVGSHTKPAPGLDPMAAHVCVRADYAREAAIGEFVWDDRGSGATYDCALWRIDNAGYMWSVESLVQGYIACNIYDEKPVRTVHVLRLPASIQSMRYGDLMIGATTLYVPTWNDRGSRSIRDVAFFSPAISHGDFDQGWRVLSHLAVPHYQAISGLVGTIVGRNVDGSIPIIKAPVSFTAVWTDKGSGADLYGSVWHPIPPTGYACLSDVVVDSWAAPSPGVGPFVCVALDPSIANQSYAREASFADVIWDDIGSGAEANVAVHAVQVGVYPPDEKERLSLLVNGFVAGTLYAGLPSATPYLLDLPPIVYRQAVTAVAPNVTSYERPDPPDTAKVVDNAVVVPCVIVNDNNHTAAWQVATSPFYKIERRIYYHLEMHANGMNCSSAGEITQQITTGVITNTTEEVTSKTNIRASSETGISLEVGWGPWRFGLGRQLSTQVNSERPLLEVSNLAFRYCSSYDFAPSGGVEEIGAGGVEEEVVAVVEQGVAVRVEEGTAGAVVEGAAVAQDEVVTGGVGRSRAGRAEDVAMVHDAAHATEGGEEHLDPLRQQFITEEIDPLMGGLTPVDNGPTFALPGVAVHDVPPDIIEDLWAETIVMPSAPQRPAPEEADHPSDAEELAAAARHDQISTAATHAVQKRTSHKHGVPRTRPLPAEGGAILGDCSGAKGLGMPRGSRHQERVAQASTRVVRVRKGGSPVTIEEDDLETAPPVREEDEEYEVESESEDEESESGRCAEDDDGDDEPPPPPPMLLRDASLCRRLRPHEGGEGRHPILEGV
ncbi:hypothetical protein CBR_g44375 [Chara braunii]|uniref:Uncharacterized protein n=1 Tax=Chara braunii TaxID=69332 RepID=A0A388LX68_CHABU|nr:hypothetical protein CBR_g44375 [Chara braunii]|eukprot:GBG86920.1 hypothetical protein CBR_g44375 [Chara braunii]